MARWLFAGLVLLLAVAIVAGCGARPVQQDTSGAAALSKADPAVLRAALAAPDVPLSAIVTESRPQSNEAERLVRSLGGTVVSELPIVSGFSARLPGSNVPALVRSSAVARLWGDAALRLNGWMDLGSYDGATPDTVWRSALHLDAVKPTINGNGVTVALLDTGVTNLSDLGNRVLARVDLTPDHDGYDHYGHGTHMSGLIAGDGTLSSGTIKGSATGAKVVSIKVAGWNGATDVSLIIRALQWVLENQGTYKIKVLNLSFGTDSRQSYRIDPLNYAVEKVWNAGILVVVSAGNSGSGPSTITKPGDDPYVLTVGGVDDKGTATVSDDVVAPFSSQGPTQDGFAKPDVVVPAISIPSLRAAGSLLDALHPVAVVGTSYFKGTGTSQAAAMVSGVAALLYQANTGMTANVAKATLMRTAQKLASMAGAGAGEVDAAAAVSAAIANTYKSSPANQGLTVSTGSGSLNASRGSMHPYTDLNNDGTPDPLVTDVDALNNPWSTAWFGVAFSKSPWAKYTSKATGWGTSSTATIWSGLGWDSPSWRATRWDAKSWKASDWTSWGGKSWSAESWPGT